MFVNQPMWHNVLAFFAAGADGGSGGSGGSGSTPNESGGNEPTPTPTPPANDAGEHGFPKDTPTEQMTVEQREAYWRYHARKHEKRAKEREDYDAIKRENEKLKAQNQTEAERAIEEARKEGKSEAEKEWAVKLARSELRGALSGRGLEGDKLEDALTFVDFNQFLDDNGDVDSVKVQRYSDTVAPQTDRQNNGGRWLDFGQGNRDEHGDRRPGGSVDAGRDAYRSRMNKNSDSTRSGVGNA